MATTTHSELIIQRGHAEGELAVTECPRAVVVLAHGPDSSRHRPGSRVLARGLRKVGFATLLIDLLIEDDLGVELHTRGLRDDVAVLTGRLVEAVDCLNSELATAELPVGLLGLGSGVAPALSAAVQRPDRVAGVVACDGRPDLVADPLSGLPVPVLLIGGEGTPGAAMNERAAQRLPAPALARVCGASKLYLEREGREDVMGLATDWFRRCLG